jgi:hypothetical protein
MGIEMYERILEENREGLKTATHPYDKMVITEQIENYELLIKQNLRRQKYHQEKNS